MKKDELLAIKQGILNEIEGYEFYKMAADRANDSGVKSAFLELAEEEFKHVGYLKDLFVKIEKDKADEFDLAFIENPPSPKIFTLDKIKDRNVSLDVAVFGIAIEMERASVNFYKTEGEKTDHKEVKKLFKLLEFWEDQHLQQFSNEYSKLKEDWWDSQGFAPF